MTMRVKPIGLSRRSFVKRAALATGAISATSLFSGPNLKVTNLPELNQWVKRPYRPGWEI
jgi:hypothetical protein